jgi:hypothetical protein
MCPDLPNSHDSKSKTMSFHPSRDLRWKHHTVLCHVMFRSIDGASDSDPSVPACLSRTAHFLLLCSDLSLTSSSVCIYMIDDPHRGTKIYRKFGLVFTTTSISHIFWVCKIHTLISLHWCGRAHLNGYADRAFSHSVSYGCTQPFIITKFEDYRRLMK